MHCRLRNELLELQRLNQEVSTFAELHHFSSEMLHNLILVLEEVVSNIMLYGYDSAQEDTIDVLLTLQENAVVLEVQDNGVPFNPLDVPDPDIERPLHEREIGGLGIYLTRTLMDELAYRREHGKNVLWMKKCLTTKNS